MIVAFLFFHLSHVLVLAPSASKRDADEIVVAKRPTKQKRAPLKDLSNIGEEEPDPSDGSVESCPTSLQFAKFEYTRNRRFNSLFPKKPSLIEFVQVVENESRAYAEDLRQVRTKRRGENLRDDPTIPTIDPAYYAFKANMAAA